MMNKNDKTNPVTSFLDSFCDNVGVEKNVLKASTQRITAKSVKGKDSKYNGLSEENFHLSFLELTDMLQRAASNGLTSIKFKYTCREATEESEETSKQKPTMTDYIIRYSADGSSYSKFITSSPANFRKMMSSELTSSVLKELGYALDKEKVTSNRRGNRVFDVVSIDWSK